MYVNELNECDSINLMLILSQLSITVNPPHYKCSSSLFSSSLIKRLKYLLCSNRIQKQQDRDAIETN